jgi:hypothetical protein
MAKAQLTRRELVDMALRALAEEEKRVLEDIRRRKELLLAETGGEMPTAAEYTPVSYPTASTAPKKSKFSPEALDRIRAAQRERWALWRKQQGGRKDRKSA